MQKHFVRTIFLGCTQNLHLATRLLYTRTICPNDSLLLNKIAVGCHCINEQRFVQQNTKPVLF